MNATQVLEVCQRLHAKGWLAAADGNVSYLESSQREVVITPSGRPKAFIEASELARVSLKNEVLSGNPSGERLMHFAVYHQCPKARAVVHAHPPTAIALSIAKPEWKELPAGVLSELILSAGAIPIAPYARPGTADMGEALRPYLPQHRLVILARHGALTWGETLEEAYLGMERLEHTCQILAQALALGGLSELPEAEVSYLKELRKKLGPKTL